MRKLFSPLFVVVHSQLRRSETRKVVNNWTTFEVDDVIFVLRPVDSFKRSKGEIKEIVIFTNYF